MNNKRLVRARRAVSLPYFTALGSLLAALVLAVAPAWAQNVDSRIQTLESELSRLKSEQMELKKEAVAAAAALPTFSYRPGGGLTITAADQSWAIKFGYEFQMDMMFLAGQDAAREGDFQLFGRRNRPAVYYYWDRGFYEFKWEFDGDGDETGGKDTVSQRSAMLIHFEQMNPWLPMMQFGMDLSGAGTKYRSSELTRELPSLDRNNGFNTGSYTGIGFFWENLPALGLPGNQQFHYNWVINSMGRSDGREDNSSKNDHLLFWNLNPFAQSKNKWINGIGVSMGAWFGNIDDRNATNSTQSFTMRSQEGPTRVTMFSTPVQGRGFHTFLSPSVQYKVGPYQLRVSAGFDRYNIEQNLDITGDTGGSKQTGGGLVGRLSGTYWKLMNDIMVWSPKGLFTGSSTTPGTLGLGYSFERTDQNCGRPNCDTSTGGGTYGRHALIVNEVDLRYWIRPSNSLWLTFKNYDSSNLPTGSQVATGCSKNVSTKAGKDCSWNDAVLGFTWTY
jgi:hypothetical protein